MIVVILRGFSGAVFSTGMDRLSEKIFEECEIEPLVTGYEHWYRIYENIKRQQDDVVLIGHSFGALACYKIVSLLKDRKFPLVVSFDYSPYYSGLIAHLPDGIVPDNVVNAMNFYQEVDPLIRGVEMERIDGSKDNIENVLTHYAHVEIDKVETLHNDVVEAIKAL